jgi:hypothetical protein
VLVDEASLNLDGDAYPFTVARLSFVFVPIGRVYDILEAWLRALGWRRQFQCSLLYKKKKKCSLGSTVSHLKDYGDEFSSRQW